MGISSEEFVYGQLLYNIPMHSEKSMLCELCKSEFLHGELRAPIKCLA